MSVEYTFNASALGVGGRYVRGGQEIVVPSLASVALAPTGGNGTAEVTDYSSEAISFKSARSRVSGRSNIDGTVFATESEIVIEGLNIFNKLSVRKLRALVTSTRSTNRGDEEGIFSVNAEYEGIMVDNCVVAPAIDDARCKATYGEHRSQVLSSHGAPFATGGPPEAEDLPGLRGDIVRTSVVKELPVQFLPGACVKTDGRNVLTIPGIGRIYFGELLVKRGKRRVNLMRIELGPQPGEDRTATPYVADSGMLSIGSGDGNGEPIWPRK
jgi:hypothetical protein